MRPDFLAAARLLGFSLHCHVIKVKFQHSLRGKKVSTLHLLHLPFKIQRHTWCGKMFSPEETSLPHQMCVTVFLNRSLTSILNYTWIFPSGTVKKDVKTKLKFPYAVRTSISSRKMDGQVVYCTGCRTVLQHLQHHEYLANIIFTIYILFIFCKFNQLTIEIKIW